MLLLALAAALGQFDAHADLGSPGVPGSATYNGATQEYVLKPGGTPHFAWKRLKGDFVLQASIEFAAEELGPQAGAGLAVRSGIAGGSFAGVVVRNDRLAAIQYQVLEGALRDQSEATLTTGDVIQLERRGNVYYFSAARFGVPLYTRQRADLPMSDEVYVGLSASTQTVFRNVRFTRAQKESFALELVDVENGRRQVVYRSPQAIEAPRWTPDGSALTFTTHSRLVRFDLETRQPSPLAADITTRNDSFSADGRYRLFAKGAAGELDIYRADAEGLGPERRLTTTRGLDAGPEYSPDGAWIYFHSARSGKLQVWRMSAEGQDPQRLTLDDLQNGYPRVAPDGKTFAMWSHGSDAASGSIRVMPADGGTAKVVAYVYGAHGTMNAPSWSPDGKLIAFVSRSD